MKIIMYLTKNDIANRLVAVDFTSIASIIRAVSDKFACGITKETAGNIMADYKAGLIAVSS